MTERKGWTVDRKFLTKQKTIMNHRSISFSSYLLYNLRVDKKEHRKFYLGEIFDLRCFPVVKGI